MFPARVGIGLDDGFGEGERSAIAVVAIAIGNGAATTGEVGDRPLVVGLIVEEAEACPLDGQRLVCLVPMAIARHEGIGAVVL